ncbi:MAG: FMN-binding protein [Acholeplasmataceae bacterium]|nr:FMN-binding protein [Acholeplasmataceae bacterium]
MDAKIKNRFDRHSLIDAKKLKFIEKALLIIVSYLVLMTIFQDGFIFGLKHALNVFIAITIVRELEVLYYAHERKLDRAQAKEFVKSDYALITALSMSVFIPFNTPIVVVAIVAALTVFVIKIIFGGYVYKVFSPALFAYLLLKLGFVNAIGANTFDNQLFTALANTGLFSNYINFAINYDFQSGFGLALSSGVILFGFFALLLIIKNFKQAITPIVFIFTYILGYVSIIGSTGLYESIMNVPFMFIAIFVLFDQTLVPTSRTGKILAALLLSGMTMIFTVAGQMEALVFGALFVQMLTPLMNQCKWITAEDGSDQSSEAASARKTINYVLVVLVLVVGIQLSWNYYSPKIGLPSVDVLQYFEDTYDRVDFEQNLTSSRDYNIDAYDTIQGVYEILSIDTKEIVAIVYDTLTEGRNGPIHVVIAVDPYTDIIVGYVVVSQLETEGLGSLYAEQDVIDTIINQSINNFAIDLITGATVTWDAYELIIQDVVANYSNEDVSLNEGSGVDVLQYFEDTYDRLSFKQNQTPTRSYNVGAYDTIQGVYEIVSIDTSEIEVIIYDAITQGRNGPIHVVIAIDPYTDTIVGYVVVSQSETEGIGSLYTSTDVINTIINQDVDDFNIDLIAGATVTWDAYDLMIQDVVDNYTNENVSLMTAIDVLQYFEYAYDRADFTQDQTPSRDYNVDAYDTITGVYEIIDNDDSSIEVLIYDIVTQGINGPIHIVIAVDPYIDTIVGYVVVSQSETEGLGALYAGPIMINSIINQLVDDFNIDLIAGATVTWDALELMVQDVVANYTNEDVSLKVVVDVLQYFEYAYDRADFTQNETPTRDYNVDAYDTITGVYEIISNDDSSIEVLIYDIVTQGINGPIHIVIAVDPNIDTIVGYVVVSQFETEGLGALYASPVMINSIINQTVDAFNIDLIAGATVTWDALELMIQDVVANYTNEEVSLNG